MGAYARAGVLASGAGSIDAAVTLLTEHGDARILVLSLGGIPVLDGSAALLSR